MSTEQDMARALVRWFFDLVGPAMQEHLRTVGHGDEWIDQYRSPLRLPNQKSSRRHCNIVRRRVAGGLPGASISPDGKQFFLTTAALSEEMQGAPLAKTHPLEQSEPDTTGKREADEDEAIYAQVRSAARGRR